MAKKNSHPASGIIAQFGKHVLPWVGDDPNRAEAVRRALQDVVAGKYPAATTAGLSPVLQAQVATAQKFLHLYGGEPGFGPEDAALAVPPAGVPEDELLLAVYLPSRDGTHGFFRTFDSWFDFAGLSRPTWRNPDLKSDATVMRLTGEYEYQPGIRWVRFRKNHDANRSSDNSRQRAMGLNGRLGGLEPLMAVSLIEGYCEGWFRDGNVAPNLSGIEVSLDGGKSWGCVLYLSRWDGADGRRKLSLSVSSAVYVDPFWGSTLVSEC